MKIFNNDRFITIGDKIWDKLNNKFVPSVNDIMNGKVDVEKHVINIGDKSYIIIQK